MTTTTVADAVERMTQRIDETADIVTEGFPHYADPESGQWTTSAGGDWTGGFWTAMLWLTYERTKDDRYLRLAERWTGLVRPRAQSETIFRGFLFWYGAALGAVLEHSQLAHEVAVEGARGLATLYNHAAGAIPLGREAEEASDVGRADTSIDGVQGSALLMWAAAETGDEALHTIAVNHARRHIEFCVRDDGSVCQSARFDVDSGALLERYTHKGYTDDSTWTRAQSWAMLGYAAAAVRAPEEPMFLQVAQRTADWWINNVPTDWVAYWDFNAPWEDATQRDTSGTATAAAALLKIAALVGEPAGTRYRDAARSTVEALISDYLTPTEPTDRRPTGILTQGCYNNRIGLATNHELIWGSYFLYEALLVLSGVVDPRLV